MRKTYRRGKRSAFGLTIFIVAFMGIVLFILLMAYSSSIRTASRTRANTKLGMEAKIACINAVEEAAYHFMTRSNSPRLSEKDKNIDLYNLLRSIDRSGGANDFDYDLPPVFTRRVSHNRRINVTDVKVRAQTRRPTGYTEDSAAVQSTGGLPATTGTPASAVPSTPKSAYESVGENLVGGEAARWCDTIVNQVQFEPRVTVVGVIEFSVTANIVGPYATVGRTMVQRRVMTLTRLSRQADISICQLAPNRIFTHIERTVESNKK